MNIEHRTPDIQHPVAAQLARHWMLGVRFWLLVVLFGTTTFSFHRATAQPQSLPSVGYATNFASVTYFEPPNEQAIKARLSGAEARPLPDSLFDLRKMKVEEFSTSGKLQAELSAPQCTYAIFDHVATSPGHFELKSGDNKFRVEGDGFCWQESESSLIISNHVRTVIKIGITNLITL